jgi:predicted N-formylglutamate amidohydrolase
LSKGPRTAAPGNLLLITCEHAGSRVPRAYAHVLRGAPLASHRGWDPGALPLARRIARRLRVPVHAVLWSRLLVESNRSIENPRIWSRWTARLPRDERERLLERYWWPHRREVEHEVRRAAGSGRRVVHVAVHTFTPVLAGEVRRADVGLLYDSARKQERAFCLRWRRCLRELDPTLRVRLNYPYRGTADGLPTWLRRRFPSAGYLGIELEVNQALLRGRRRGAVEDVVTESLALILPSANS